MTNYTPEQRLAMFWSRVDKSDGDDACWLWTAAANSQGYGTMLWRGRVRMAHRISYELVNDVVPDNLCVLHRCDTPSCVNPTHLSVGTRLDNNHDRDIKGRGGDRRGILNGRTKLSDAAVQEIRSQYSRGDISQENLGKLYGVGQCHIWRIVHGKSRLQD